MTAGLDDSTLGGGGGADGGRYDNGEAGDGAMMAGGDDENMLDVTGPMEPVAMVPQVGYLSVHAFISLYHAFIRYIAYILFPAKLD